MTYQSTISPIPKEELDNILCFKYVNIEVSEADLRQWDKWFVQLRKKPHVYSISNRGKQYTFYVDLVGEHVDVDWRVYRTWNNTFHLRYEALLNELGIQAKNPHIHQEQQFLVARLMEDGREPKALAECSLRTGQQ